MGHKGENGRSSARKNHPKMSQNGAKSNQKRVKNGDGLQGAVSIDLGPIFRPRWCQNETNMEAQIVAKTGCYQKGAFSLPYSKNRRILMNLRVRGFHFGSYCRTEIDEKTEFDSKTIFGSFFIDV